ncbi:hypothetical protein NA57DRAFT_67850 [Rhizodiscina lignyota]|uniref:Uncharacterized protein n=1 Tax=Rhizodiscina lignyota TaxID=1504668 RepID=A0A9P4IBB5_9PEZI|nr:hypothetical protein NA57DRAFT_67850 [Rhizodiscina lignyota]
MAAPSAKMSSPDQDVTPSSSVTAALLHYKELQNQERLSLSPAVRAIFATGAGFLVGLALGSSHGSQTAGLRFRAENAHRLPTSQKGWFFYHKSKNYHMALGAMKEGIKMGVRTGFLVGLFAVTEDMVDEGRASLAEVLGRREGLLESKDFVSTVVAGLGTAGAFSVWNRFTVAEAARTAKLGLVVGLGYGLLQDGISLLRGRRLGYVELIRHRRRSECAEERAGAGT